MVLPPELQPTGTIDIKLPSGLRRQLPVCRRTFPRWGGEALAFRFGSKPVLDYKGAACFAELVILGILRENGWCGVWVQTYGGTHYLRSMPQGWSLKSEHVSIPPDKEAILKGIWKTAGTKACFDVFAWRGTDILFCEAKHQPGDKLTRAQCRFIEGALDWGLPKDQLLVVEWTEILTSVPRRPDQ
jgi:hypothetical protein